MTPKRRFFFVWKIKKNEAIGPPLAVSIGDAGGYFNYTTLSGEVNILMPKEAVDVQEWQNRVHQDITEIKGEQSRMSSEQQAMKDAIRDLQFSDKLQDQEIKTLKEALFEIKDDTNWIRRKITGAIITAAITAVVGGLIAVAIAKLF